MELMVPIENKDSIPLYEQIYRYIKTEIRAGRLRAGSRLPSTRTLADNLHVSRSTTQLAYEQLLSEGYIEALPCRGYFVCQIEELVEVKYHGVPEEKEEKQEENENYNYKVDFSPRGIDLDSFPFNAWRKLSKNTLVDDNKDMFAVGNAQGEYSLRQVIRDYLHSARGVHCRPEQILSYSLVKMLGFASFGSLGLRSRGGLGAFSGFSLRRRAGLSSSSSSG